MTYQPVTVTATLSNTVQTTPGFVKLSDDKVFIPFDYRKEEDIKVSPETTSYRFVNATTVEILQEWETNSLPQTVTFTRETPIDLQATFYPGSAIRAADLNDNFRNIRLKLEELDYAS